MPVYQEGLFIFVSLVWYYRPWLGDADGFGADFGHISMLVRLSGEDYLVDVGFASTKVTQITISHIFCAKAKKILPIA